MPSVEGMMVLRCDSAAPSEATSPGSAPGVMAVQGAGFARKGKSRLAEPGIDFPLTQH